MPTYQQLLAARRATQTIYERQATTFDQQRPRAFHEKAWIDRFLTRVKPGGHILELGCGAGEPVSAYILSKGFRLTGTDYAAAMIEIAQKRFPKADWQVMDMRRLAFSTRFDGVLSWDGSFHLTEAEQQALIPAIAKITTNNAALLLTVGPEAGEVTGRFGHDQPERLPLVLSVE